MDIALISSSRSMTVFLIILAFLSINDSFLCSSTSSPVLPNSTVLCIPSERQALVKFKQDITADPSNRLASWATGDSDCCNWAGVVCNNFTGHVLKLHLGNSLSSYQYMLTGKINPSLQNLKHLRHLDLGFNNFSGMIPSEIGNLSGLQFLSFGNYYYYEGLYVDTLHWLSSLSSLRYLYLTYVNLSRASDHWWQVTNMLPSLSELRLSGCTLDRFSFEYHHLPINVNFTNLLVLDLSGNYFGSSIPSVLRNLTSLRDLDLSFNSFNSTIPDWLYSFSHLEHLNLGYNSLQGSISSAIGNLTSAITLDLSSYNNQLKGKLPTSFGDLCSLRVIHLSGILFGGDVSDQIFDILSRCILEWLEVLSLQGCGLSGNLTVVIEQLGKSKNLTALNLESNSLKGHIPASIVKLSTLEHLYLSNNGLTGNLPDSLGQLTNLMSLQLSQNSLQGDVSEVHFVNLTRLQSLWLSRNKLTFRVNPNWVPSFQIRQLHLSSCQLGPKFPMWLHSQKKLSLIDMSNNEISDTIPSWFWEMSSNFFYLNLSHNHIKGEIVYLPSASVIDLGSNHFEGPLPSISYNVIELHLKDNSFSGSLSSFLCYRMDEAKRLRVLDLEGNLFSGEVPDCWINWASLEFVHLGNNHLTGYVPSSMGFLKNLQSLQLCNNSLSGEFPLPLQNCTRLLVVDFGKNQFSGKVPAWIGERLSYLKILILQSNRFHGQIPTEICRLSSLQIMAFAQNNLHGTIPRCLDNFSAMISKQESSNYITTYNTFTLGTILDTVILILKGREDKYSTILNLVTLLDLSNNKLSGEIPMEVTKLAGLQSLNLSSNRLMGRIPWGVGSMTMLESMDLSSNQLFGEIPPSMSSLTFLSQLNLSYNNLTGRIPTGTQLQSLNASSFAGNKLCGRPLIENCSTNGVQPTGAANRQGKGNDGPQVEWFYVTMGLGFVVGFWGTFGPILFIKSCRFSYFQFLDRMWFKFWELRNKCC